MIEADGDEIENPILPRMHLGVKYQHKYSWSELQSIVILVVSKLSKLYETKTFPTGKNEKEVESNIFGVLENEEFVKNNSYLNSKIFEWVKHTLNKIKHLHVLMYVIVKNITYMKKINWAPEEWNKVFGWDIEFITKSIEEISNNFDFINSEVLKEIIEGDIILWPSSVLIVLRWVLQISETVYNCIEQLQNKNKQDYYK